MSRFCVILHDGDIDEGTKADLRVKFENHEECLWCGGLHNGMCPRVRKIVYHPNDDRVIRKVEFWPEGGWSRSNIVFAEDVV